mmetsp:Transcript_20956/g.36081  ORF Transcript_20956/g.36081 Transcript_20956/m.36081 type:complete len:97 (-) Transcript_20956:24-314(-)
MAPVEQFVVQSIGLGVIILGRMGDKCLQMPLKQSVPCYVSQLNCGIYLMALIVKPVFPLIKTHWLVGLALRPDKKESMAWVGLKNPGMMALVLLVY